MKWALHRKGGKPAVQKSVKKVPRRQKSGQFIQKELIFGGNPIFWAKGILHGPAM